MDSFATSLFSLALLLKNILLLIWGIFHITTTYPIDSNIPKCWKPLIAFARMFFVLFCANVIGSTLILFLFWTGIFGLDFAGGQVPLGLTLSRVLSFWIAAPMSFDDTLRMCVLLVPGFALVTYWDYFKHIPGRSPQRQN